MRRGIGNRPFRQGLGTPFVPPLLKRANELLAAGDYPGAASTFAQLAANADGRNGPAAPFFHIQAGRANLLAGQKSAGYDEIKKGLVLLAERRRFPRLYKAGNRVIGELKQNAMTKEADDLTAWMKTALPIGFTPPPGLEPAKKPTLPTKCPSCGAAVHPDEVEWMDDVTAECAYCGSAVRGE
jgi:hypothetical protein